MYTSQEISTKLFTLKQVAKMLSVNPDTLRKWDNNGILKAMRIGSRRDRRYRNEDIQKIINHGLTTK